MNKRIVAISALAGWFLLLSADNDYQRAQLFDVKGMQSRVLARDLYDDRRIQLHVAPQSSSKYSSEGLTGSSCGYHALKNGVIFARSLLSNESRSSYLQGLTSESAGDDLFGSMRSPWRIDVMKERYKSPARRIFKKQLLDQCARTSSISSDEFELFKEVIQGIDPMAIYYPEVMYDSFRYTATTNDVYRAVSERIQHLITHDSSKKYLLERINARSKFDSVFSGAKVEFSISFDGACTSPLSPGRVLERITGERHGRWIDNYEMPHLIEAQRFTEFLGAYPDLVVTTFDEDLSSYHKHPHISTEFRKLTSTLKSSQKDCVGVVLVYLPGGSSDKGSRKSVLGRLFSWMGSLVSSSEESVAEDLNKQREAQNNGHWIALVVAQLKSVRHYYVFDSLGTIRLNDERINDVIDVLDGKMILPDDVTASTSGKSSGSWKGPLFKTTLAGALCYLGYKYFKKK